MRRMFEPRPGREVALFAEAQALIEGGLEADFVVGLYPEEAPWLAPQLEAARALAEGLVEEPSFYFEGSLKAKMLGAARRKALAAQPAPVLGPARLGLAMSAAAMAAVGGFVMLLGAITAEDSVPGDWNYSYKLAGERLDYLTSRGQDRIDLQFKFTETRVQEIDKKLQSGADVSAGDLAKFEREARELAAALRDQQLDATQRNRLTELEKTSVAVLNDVRRSSSELDSQVSSALTQVSNAVAAGTGGTRPLPDPTPGR